MMAFHRKLSDGKSPQVSGTLLSILAVLNNVVVWMISNRPVISKSSSLFINPLMTVRKAPITIGISLYLLIESFSHLFYLIVFHWRLSDIKSAQVSRTILSILAVLSSAVVWMVSTRPPSSILQVLQSL